MKRNYLLPVVALVLAASALGHAQKSVDLPINVGWFNYSPDGKYLRVTDNGGSRQQSLVRLSDGKVLLSKVESIQFSTDGRFAAAIKREGNDLGALEWVDLGTGKVNNTNAKGYACAISPDGAKIALSDTISSFIPLDRKARPDPSIQIYDRKTRSSRKLQNFLKDLVLNINGPREAGGTRVGTWTPDGLEITYSYPLSAGISRARLDVNKDRVNHKFPWYFNDASTLADGSTITQTKKGLFFTLDGVTPQKQILARKDWPEDIPFLSTIISPTSNVVACFGSTKDGAKAGVWALNAVSRQHARLVYSRVTKSAAKQSRVIYATPSPDGSVIACSDFLASNRIDFYPVPKSVRLVDARK